MRRKNAKDRKCKDKMSRSVSVTDLDIDNITAREGSIIEKINFTVVCGNYGRLPAVCGACVFYLRRKKCDSGS